MGKVKALKSSSQAVAASKGSIEKRKHVTVFSEEGEFEDEVEKDSRTNNKIDTDNSERSDDSDAPEEVNINDESIRRLQELHNQIKSSNSDSNKNKKQAKKKALKIADSKGAKDGTNDDKELDLSVLEFLENRENEEEEERIVRDNEKAKKKNREPDVTFRIDKDAVRSRKIGSLTVATIDFDPASNSSSVHILDSFPLNSSVQTFTKTRHDSRERISLSRFNSLKKVGPSKVFSSSKLKSK